MLKSVKNVRNSFLSCMRSHFAFAAPQMFTGTVTDTMSGKNT